jgi:hypothetical protein
MAFTERVVAAGWVASALDGVLSTVSEEPT